MTGITLGPKSNVPSKLRNRAPTLKFFFKFIFINFTVVRQTLTATCFHCCFLFVSARSVDLILFRYYVETQSSQSARAPPNKEIFSKKEWLNNAQVNTFMPRGSGSRYVQLREIIHFFDICQEIICKICK